MELYFEEIFARVAVRSGKKDGEAAVERFTACIQDARVRRDARLQGLRAAHEAAGERSGRGSARADDRDGAPARRRRERDDRLATRLAQGTPIEEG